MIKFSFHITTKNRLEDLKVTLNLLKSLLSRNDVEVVVVDDASTDGTSSYIKENYHTVKLKTNTTSLGLIANRNWMLNTTTAQYAISLDDDSNFLTEDCLAIIENYFITNKNCGLIACRIFWGKEVPKITHSNEKNEKVNGYVGCGHVWNLKAWQSIPNYPEWYFFYGEEDFASMQLLKKGIEIHYVPQILVHHRVSVSERKKDKDYQVRRRRSLRAAWYNYFIFYPISIIPKKMLYTIWQQVKKYTFKGDFKATLALIQALFDVLLNIPNFLKNRNALTIQEFQKYISLPDAKIYWNPNNEK